MPRYNETQTLETQIKDLQTRLRTLETTPRLTNASIDTGGLSVNNGGNIVVNNGGNIVTNDGGNVTINNGGNVIVQGGDIVIDDSSGNPIGIFGHNQSGRPGAALINELGNSILDYYKDPTSGRFWLVINDGLGNPILSTDGNGTGVGMAWPRMPFMPWSMTVSTWGQTTSGTFDNCSSCYTLKYSQQVYVSAFGYADPGTNGQMRFTLDGTQVGSLIGITGGAFTDFSFGSPNPVSNAIVLPNGSTYASIQARVTSGAGKVYVQPYFCAWYPA